MDREQQVRTTGQNRALHAYFRELAKALNDSGFEMKKFFEVKEYDVPWNEGSVKELIWRQIQVAMLNKKSTTDLDTDEINSVYEVVQRKVGEMTGVYVPFVNRGLQ